MKADKFNVLVQNRIGSAIIQTFNKDCIITKVIAQSIKKRKDEGLYDYFVLKELTQSEWCTCYARGTVGHDIMIWYANEKINLRIQVEQKNISVCFCCKTVKTAYARA